MLQSKRLYPDEQSPEEDTALDYMIGYARLMQGDEDNLAAQQERWFTFSVQSEYRALVIGDNQYQTIAAYETTYKIPVHYLLYNPLSIPMRRRIPISVRSPARTSRQFIGAHVLRATTLRTAMQPKPRGYSPTFAEMMDLNGWRLEVFVADELLRCREGYRAQGAQDEGLFQVFNRRAGPIAAAIAITIDRS